MITNDTQTTTNIDKASDKSRRLSVLPLRINDEDHLFKSYMSFLNHGGLFVETKRTYGLGQKVFLKILMPDSDEKITTAGEVAWVTPQNVRGGKKKGIGVAFIDKKGIKLGQEIAHLLRYRLASDEPTYTM